MSDMVFHIDQFQSNSANDRVLCPVVPEHGPMFVHGSGGKMLCNDPKCKVETGVPPELIAALPH